MKNLLCVLVVIVSLASQTASAGSGDRTVTVAGCDAGDAQTADVRCWVNISSTNPIPGAACTNRAQLRWVLLSQSGVETTGDALFAMALTAASTGNKLRIGVSDTECIGDFPKVVWMSLIP